MKKATLSTSQMFIKNKGYRCVDYLHKWLVQGGKKTKIYNSRKIGENSRRYSWIYLRFPISNDFFFSLRGIQRAATWEEKSS